MLRHLLRRTPLAWFQVTREKTRLLVALAGIAFADILMFIQLGFQDALYDSSKRPHQSLKADIVLINSQFQTLFSVKSFPRERLYQAAGFAGVESVNALYIASGQWRNPETRQTRTILIFGTNPAQPAFNFPELEHHAESLSLLGRVFFDRESRPEYGQIAAQFQQQGLVETEVNDKRIQVEGLFGLGASFAADGNVIASDSTFLHLFPTHQPERIEVGLINLKPGNDPATVVAQMRMVLPQDVKAITPEEFGELEKLYWESGTGIGFIFGLGVSVGFIVGTVIVYQILYADVSEHLPEYATLKAIGYSDRYLLGVLMQEALLLAILGYIPGFILSLGLYQLAFAATLLPVVMKIERAIAVLALTIIMCSASGAIAMRKLQSADPADIF